MDRYDKELLRIQLNTYFFENHDIKCSIIFTFLFNLFDCVNPLNCFFRTKKFVTYRDCHKVFASSIHMLAITSTSVVQPVSNRNWQKTLVTFLGTCPKTFLQWGVPIEIEKCSSSSCFTSKSAPPALSV